MTHNSAAEPGSRPVRDAADAFVGAAAELNPLLATMLGLPDGQDRLPDLSPAGQEASDELVRATLERISEVERAVGGTGFADADERRCARLLRERLETDLAISATGEHLRSISNIFGPPQQVRGIFLLMPTATATTGPSSAGGSARSRPRWQATGRRWLRARPAACLRHRARCRPWRVSSTCGSRPANGPGWFADFAAGAPGDRSTVAARLT